jgi:hypothetical protein
VLKINSKSYFNKWEVYRDLSPIPQVREYLPDTKLYENETDLAEFLETYHEAYLKGVRGGRGRWIFRVLKQPEGKFKYSYHVNKIVNGQADNWDDLVRKIHKFYRNRTFVIQQAIDLIRINDGKIDFRAEMQRDGMGELKIIGVSARIGKSKSPITIHSSAYPIEVFFEKFLRQSEDATHQLVEKIYQFLFTIYTTLEQVYGTFGEIGIDFGLDKNEKIWLLEPNSKSSKVSLKKAYDEKTYHQAFVNPLKFAKFLYNKSSKE